MKYFLTAIAFAGIPSQFLFADIFRWDNGELIPGTEAITLMSGVNLDHRHLAYADFVGQDLSGSSFEAAFLDHAAFHGTSLVGANFAEATLANAEFNGSELTGAIFRNADLNNAELRWTVLTDAEFDNAIIRNARFCGGGDGFCNGAGGFTTEQLKATASYKEKDLSGTSFDLMDFKEMDFREYNLANTWFTGGSLVGSDLRQAHLYQAYLEADLTDAKLNDSIIKGAKFYRQLSAEQLYSTQSYKEKDLGHIQMSIPDNHSWDLSGQNLSGSYLRGDGTKFASIEGAIVTGARLDISPEQLYSTESYKNKDLKGIGLGGDISGWDFSEQNLTGARLSGRNISQADFRRANLTGVQFHNATLTSTNFTNTVIAGANLANAVNFTANQLYSTDSYVQQDLRNVNLSGLDLSGWDLSGQDLSNAILRGADLTGSNLDDANLFGADLLNTIGFSPADSTNVRNVIRTPSEVENEESPFGYLSGTIDGLELRNGERMILDYERFLGAPILVKDQLQLSDESVLELDVHCGIGCSFARFYLEEGTPVTLGGTLRVGHVPNSYLAGIGKMSIFEFDPDVVFSNSFFSSFELPVGNWDVSFLTATGEIYLVDKYRGDGDLNVDGELDVQDIDRLSRATRVGRDFSYDLNSDRIVDQQDRVFWIREFKHTWFGDANLDGEFNSGDLVQVFQAGHYEDDVAMNSGWAEGDWNGDGDFNTSDLVVAFQDGGYERGPRIGAIPVPEPTNSSIAIGCIIALCFQLRGWRCRFA